jgi:hypothetical protein
VETLWKQKGREKFTDALLEVGEAAFSRSFPYKFMKIKALLEAKYGLELARAC